MSGKELLADTNILLYLLQGNDTIRLLLQDKVIVISFITELELLGFAKLTMKEEKQIQQLLQSCIIVQLNDSIKLNYVKLRRKYNLRMADAVIAATALSQNIPLITADKHFRNIEQLELVAYEAF
jgi:predicted nucleic acid-binding protein